MQSIQSTVDKNVFVKFGDVVTLYCDQLNGWLTSGDLVVGYGLWVPKLKVTPIACCKTRMPPRGASRPQAALLSLSRSRCLSPSPSPAPSLPPPLYIIFSLSLQKSSN